VRYTPTQPLILQEEFLLCLYRLIQACFHFDLFYCFHCAAWLDMNYTKLEFDTIYMGQDKQMTSMGSLAFVGTLENVIFNTKYLIDK